MGNESVSILVVAYALLIEQGERNLNFLFDICRWQVKEGDKGVTHETMTDHHLSFYQQSFIEAMGAVAATITQACAAVREGQVTSKGLWHIILQHLSGEGIQW